MKYCYSRWHGPPIVEVACLFPSLGPLSGDVRKSRGGQRCTLRWGPIVAIVGVTGAAARRAKARTWLADVTLRTILPHRGRHELVTSRPSSCPELDCVRHLLPRRTLAAAERRARSVGVGAERVLVCADAMTEEAYLVALASSLGTSFERFDANFAQ